MDSKQLTQGLQRAFFTENHRIVFWYDAERNFVDELGQLELPDVTVVNMQGESTFGLKLKLELDDTGGKYLLYFPWAEPQANDDWLLDIKLYSRSFYADRISLIFNELGLQQPSLREHLIKREKFLSNKARLAALKKMLQPTDSPEVIDLSMVAVITGAPSPDIPAQIFTLAEQMVQTDLGLEGEPASIAELYKFDLAPALLQGLRQELSYPVSQDELSGEKPFRLGHFLIRLLITGLCENLGEIPEWANSLSISGPTAHATIRTLLSRWRDSSRYYQSFDVISSWVSIALKIPERVRDLSVDQLSKITVFEAAEKQIIADLSNEIPKAAARDLGLFKRIIAERLDGYWASQHKTDDLRRKYRLMYTALKAAIELFTLRKQYEEGFHFSSTEAAYKAYVDELFQIDTGYRHYFAASHRANVEILKKLDDEVETLYSEWYADQLGRNWGDLIEAEDRLSQWAIPGVPNQQNFYDVWVAPFYKGASHKRVAVIISDALRYEVAMELKDRINQKRYSEASIGTQLGVLPSYTKLGMAALLPHKTLEYRETSNDLVFVDGQSSGGTPQRDAILRQHSGMAVTAQEVRTWSRDAGREALKDIELVYVYHNVIDDRSDKGGPSEGDTFAHAEDAIEELNELAKKFLMHFNTSTVIITADHGFLFQHRKPSEAGKISKEEVPAEAFKYNKRYLLGHTLPTNPDVWQGCTQQTAGTLSDTRFWIPKGNGRFNFSGGSRFVHGGAMLQEIVVPVVTIKQLRGEHVERRTKRKVEVISLKSSLKMVTSIQRFDLTQTEGVTDQILPITISVAIYEGDKAVSSEETVTFDCKTDSMAERTKQVRLSLLGNDFDRKRDYFLVLRDKDLNTELVKYRVVIDLAFTDDFF